MKSAFTKKQWNDIYDRLYARDPGLLGVVFDWRNY